MFWIFAALILLGILSVTITHRGPVRIAGCVLLAVLLGWALYQRLSAPVESQEVSTRGISAPPASATQPIDVDAIDLEELTLTGGGAPFQLRGKIVNRSSDLRMTAFTLRTTRRDCYEGAIDPTGCVVIWRDQHWIRWSVPAGQTREFLDTIWAHTPVARVRGTLKDDFELLAVTGTPDL